MKKFGLVLLIAIGLVGCSTKFVYNNMDWLLVRYLQDYVELDDDQESLASEKIATLSQWHREQEIPHYIEHLDELMAIEPATFTVDDLISEQQKLEAHTTRLVAKVTPELYELASQLSDEQVEELMDNIRVKHTQYKKRYQDLSEEAIRQRYKTRIEENIETWVGDLTDEQQLMVDQWVADMTLTNQDWVAHQTRMRVELNALLAVRVEPSLFQPKLQSLMDTPDKLYSADLEQKIAYNQQLSRRYLVTIINSMTPDQTAHYRQEIQEWKEIALSIR